MRPFLIFVISLSIPGSFPSLVRGQVCDPTTTCSGHGTCDLADDSCICDVGWTGASCDEPVCEQACVNGTCVGPDACECELGWTGLICSLPICDPNCVIGFCVNPNQCACVIGWMGDICDTPVCDPACVNGTCTAPGECECESGWTGTLCDVPTCDPLTDCSGHGTCDLDDGSCICDVGWTGAKCDSPVCEPPCVNGDCTASNVCVCDDGWLGADCSESVGAGATLDIKPSACPNRLPRRGRGWLAVALVGSSTFDVSTIDEDTIVLFRADGVGGEVRPAAGPPGPHTVIDDVATPFHGEVCACHTLAGDGTLDLLMRFRRPTVIDVLDLGVLPRGSVVELVLAATLFDGTTITVTDCVTIN